MAPLVAAVGFTFCPPTRSPPMPNRIGGLSFWKQGVRGWSPNPYFFVRTINVTGPSLTTRRIMAAPKTPVRTVRPCRPANVSATRW